MKHAVRFWDYDKLSSQNPSILVREESALADLSTASITEMILAHGVILRLKSGRRNLCILTDLSVITYVAKLPKEMLTKYSRTDASVVLAH